jgi:hypothetical protein
VKLELMREFFDLSQAFEQVLRGLQSMERVPFFQTESLRCARAEVEAARVDASREFFDNFGKIVENDARWAYKFHRDYKRRTQDPFDFYLELKEREDIRRKKGLPLRAILLPGWDQDDDGGRMKKSTGKAKTVVAQTRKRSDRPSARKAERKRDE